MLLTAERSGAVRVPRAEGGTARRLLDILVGALLCVAALPVVVAFAIALALTLRDWPFFIQTRIGRDGREFRFVKLRTLPRRTPAYADKYAIRDVAMPAIARVLRSTHLDELPQLALVLAGTMSLVGPRPEMPHLHVTFAGDHRRAREALRPGCAGIWQVSVDNDRLISEAPEYDLFYAEHASLRLDVWVLWRTALLVATGRRVTLADVPNWVLRSRPTVDLRSRGVEVGSPAVAA